MKAHCVSWRRRVVPFGIAAFFVGLLLTSASPAQEMRTWTDATGQFKIQAKLQSVAGGKVSLVRDDGSVMEIELSQLSAEDQKYASSQRANPFKPAAASPFKTVTGAAGTAAATGSAEPRLVTVDWSATELVPMMPEDSEWKIAVGPLEKPAPMKNRSIPIPAVTDYSERFKALVVNHSGNRVLAGYMRDHSEEGDFTRLVLADISLGRALPLKPVQREKLIPLALSDSGTDVLLKYEGYGEGRGRLELWKITSSGIHRLMACVPDRNNDVTWAEFIDAERFATMNRDGQLAVWYAASFQPQFQLKLPDNCTPALSPDRKYLAFVFGEQLGILDLAARKIAAMQPCGNLVGARFCFSPDGGKLACMTIDRIIVWNVADGSEYRNLPTAGQGLYGESMIWLRDQYLLIGKMWVFDIENQVRLWTLNGHEAVDKCGGACVFAVTPRNSPGALVVATVPSPSFDTAMAKVMKAPDFFVLKKGTTVKLNVDGLPDAGERDKAQSSLTRKLQALRFQVGPQGTIELAAAVVQGEEQEIAYRTIGSFGARAYRVKPYYSTVKFLYQGKPVWQMGSSSIPHVLSVQDGETVEQALRRCERPNYSLFDRVELPGVLLKPMGPLGLGSSQVTAAGIQ